MYSNTGTPNHRTIWKHPVHRVQDYMIHIFIARNVLLLAAGLFIASPYLPESNYTVD